MSEKYYKVLNEDGSCFHGGSGKWPLPGDGQPGGWMPRIEGELKACSVGYHVLTASQLVQWLGPAIFQCETLDIEIQQDDKNVCRAARLLRRLEGWNEKTARLFAADCAEHVLPIFEKKHADDKRPRVAIQAARDYANGKITSKQLAAAWAAAWAAAGDAAGDAARDAAWDAARTAAWAAAWAAAWDAAWAAAWDAAWDAAGTAVRAAAWAAAWDAAWDAAGTAARAAARDAAWDAARDAAWDAERRWQTDRLMQLLGI